MANPETATPDDDGEVWVECLHCGAKQPDMGANVMCETCEEGPMPFYRDGKLVEPS